MWSAVVADAAARYCIGCLEMTGRWVIVAGVVVLMHTRQVFVGRYVSSLS